MKGRKLSLQEVLNLEDGCKVWVEEFEDYKPRLFNLRNYLCEKKCDRLSELNTNLCSMLFRLDGTENCLYYEWIEDNSNPMMIFEEDDESDIIHNLAQEICKLRGLDLTDENIRLIIKEFEEEK